MAGKTPSGPTWETGGIMTPDEVRIEASAVGPPKLVDIVVAELMRDAVGYLPQEFVPRPAVRGVGRYVIFDRFGVRHFDQTPARMFLRRKLNPRIDFAVPWTELGHIGLQIQRSQTTPLQMIRVILGPLDPDGFAARRPELGILRNLTGLSPAFWAISMGMYLSGVDQSVLAPTGQALQRFAGNRYPGQVSVWP